MASAALARDRVLHYLPRQVKFYSLSSHVIDIKRLFQRNKLLYCLERSPFTESSRLVNNLIIYNMVAVSLLQVKKLRWGKLSQILQRKVSAPKYCEFSDENCESLYVVFHCQNDLKVR